MEKEVSILMSELGAANPTDMRSALGVSYAPVSIACNSLAADQFAFRIPKRSHQRKQYFALSPLGHHYLLYNFDVNLSKSIDTWNRIMPRPDVMIAYLLMQNSQQLLSSDDYQDLQKEMRAFLTYSNDNSTLISHHRPQSRNQRDSYLNTLDKLLNETVRSINPPSQ